MYVPKTWNQKLSISVHSGGAGWNGEPGADSHDPLSLGNHSDAILQSACCHVDHSGIRNGNGLASPVARNAVNRWVAMHTVVHAWCVASDNFVVDRTWDEGTEYFGVPFRHDYLRRVLKARRDYGLIDNPEMAFRW
jgi:hypothetical protein